MKLLQFLPAFRLLMSVTVLSPGPDISITENYLEETAKWVCHRPSFTSRQMSLESHPGGDSEIFFGAGRALCRAEEKTALRP